MLRQMDSLFIDPEVPIDFINFLEKTGQQSFVGLDIAPFSVGQSEKEFWPFLNFQLTVTGPFPSFLNFLEKIENSPYLIEIQSITISQASESKQSPGTVKSLLNFKVFSNK
jgi:Tfp pilus assembly protein PilO